MPLLLVKDLSPHAAFSLVYPWLEAHGLLKTCKPLAAFLRLSNIFYSFLATNNAPESGLDIPGLLFQQGIDL